MYRYDGWDAAFVRERIARFRDQVARRLRGELSEEEFRPWRLMNGVYLQLHAYMLRVAIPYGTLSAPQLRRLADIAERYDRGYGHFTTRQNIQFNWPRLVDIPDILEALAEVEMHAIQTSGNCIRNITSDPWAGVASDEIDDPRPWCELLRQWSSDHQEFTFLPRKFKVAVSGGLRDRAAVRIHDIGLRLRRDRQGRIGFEVLVGGGLGRTPLLAQTVRDWIPGEELLSYLTAILRVYNRFGRRDNKYKARIKILVHDLGIERFRQLVDEEYAAARDPHLARFAAAEVARIRPFFAPPPYADRAADAAASRHLAAIDGTFARWLRTNTAPHRRRDYAIVQISLKPPGGVPGNMTAAQMRALADLAERYSCGEIRVTAEQNLVLPHVARGDLPALWEALETGGLATPNLGHVSDIVSCPGLDFCALATARSIPVAQAIGRRFADLDRQYEIGPLKLKMSGCINACGHHHVAHIGILGLEKRGRESYQITLGGSGGEAAAIGRVLGPGFGAEEIVDAVERVITTYLAGRRNREETFLDYLRRVGLQPFKDALYASV